MKENIHLVFMPAALKDPRALYLDCPPTFPDRFRELLAKAQPAADLAAARAQAAHEAAGERCRELARSPHILDRFAASVAASGLAGETRLAQLVFLCLMTRFLDWIVSLVIKGPSSAGKSFVARRVLDYFPAAAYYELTAMSDKALAYFDEPLAHRFLVIFEAAGLAGDMATYLLRSLLSEGRILYDYVSWVDGAGQSVRIEIEGPTGLLLTTTEVRLHPENETRMISPRITDTRAQTKAVLLAVAEGRKPSAEELDLWHALQEWLAGAEHRVSVPFLRLLAELTEPIATRLRRDFPALASLIRAHAILHQETRERDEEGRVVATLEDYGVVHELVGDLMAEGVEATVSQTVRETVAAVEELVSDHPGGARSTSTPTCSEHPTRPNDEAPDAAGSRLTASPHRATANIRPVTAGNARRGSFPLLLLVL